MEAGELLFLFLALVAVALVVAPVIFIIFVYFSNQTILTDEQFDKKWAELIEASKRGKKK